ncbi:MAG: hypothetical protein V3V28_13420 [Polaribacter sp.]|uniref:hypothetical protein n=1 Tax=Polaribacter sp. TaxID=1920175 RepID=UPI002F353F83
MEKKQQFKSVRAFIGTKNQFRNFYRDFGFYEVVLSEDMSLFKVENHLGFYLQKAFVKDWVDNSMLF